MSTDHAHTDRASHLRALKATRVEALLRAAGIDATAAAHLTPVERRRIEKAAGVRPCSTETWTLIARLLASGRAS